MTDDEAKLAGLLHACGRERDAAVARAERAEAAHADAVAALKLLVDCHPGPLGTEAGQENCPHGEDFQGNPLRRVDCGLCDDTACHAAHAVLAATATAGPSLDDLRWAVQKLAAINADYFEAWKTRMLVKVETTGGPVEALRRLHDALTDLPPETPEEAAEAEREDAERERLARIVEACRNG